MPKNSGADVCMDLLLNVSKTMDYAFHDGNFYFLEVATEGSVSADVSISFAYGNRHYCWPEVLPRNIPNVDGDFPWCGGNKIIAELITTIMELFDEKANRAIGVFITVSNAISVVSLGEVPQCRPFIS